MKREILTPANLLSISRILLVIPFVLVMLSSIPSARLWGGALMILAALTDKFDGVLARKYGYETEWGRILDPLADKIGVGAVALVLLNLGEIPVWFVGALLSRDLLIFLGGVLIKIRRGVVPGSNQAGKWAVGIVALTLFLMVLQGRGIVVTCCLWASVGMLLISFAGYVQRFVQTINTKAP